MDDIWHVVEKSLLVGRRGKVIVLSSDGRAVLNVYKRGWNMGKTERNARIAAAAPELLRCLKSMQLFFGVDAEFRNSEQWTKNQRVINKADGRLVAEDAEYDKYKA